MSMEKSKKSKKFGILVGGSGLIGGTLTHYFKTKAFEDFEIRAPNSKKLSLRESDDIKGYFNRFRPDFIINTAIASIDSDAQLSFEVNYLGSIKLAKVAIELGIPYFYISTAATLSPGMDLSEEDYLKLNPKLGNYPKSKLMTELTLQHLHKNEGLDYTNIRLAVVYGEHDHKIQGFHRLLYNLVDEAMPFLFTKPEVLHSYSNSLKLPYFVHHALLNREEFSGQTYNFVDRNPVNLAQLILTIKSFLSLNVPKEIYIPYPLAKTGKVAAELALRFLTSMGIKARMPAEIQFLENFYQNQVLSAKKLEASSFVDPFPETTIFTELPVLIEYYLTRWEHLNLVSFNNDDFFDPKGHLDRFINSPDDILESIHDKSLDPFSDF
jgi:GlcNAc-P-P-Und epimerase